MKLRAWVAVAALLVAAPVAAHEVKPPEPILQPAAEWPGKPDAHDVVVPVVLTVAKDGAVEHVEIVAKLSPKLDAAAVRAARRWVFRPAQAHDGPVAAKVRAIVRFVGVAEAPKKPEAKPPNAKPPAPAAKPRDDVQVVGHGQEEHDLAVLVTGRRRPRGASEQRIDRRVLQAAPRRSASDMLSSVPGVFVTQHSGQGKAHQIFFRGFDAVHGQDIEVSVGGVPVNEVSNLHGQGYADLHFVIPEVVDAIDVLPGTYDASQGDFAVAGSMRYRLGYREPGITLRGSYGSFGARRLFLGFHPEGESAGTFAAFEAYATDGFGTARAAERTSGMGQVELDLGPRARLRLMGSAYAGRFDSPGVLVQGDIDARRIDRFGSYDPNQGGDSARLQLSAELLYGGDDWRLSVMPWAVRRSLQLRFNFTGELYDDVRGDNVTQDNDATTFGLRATFDRDLALLSDHDALKAGVAVRHDIIDQSQRPSEDGAPASVDVGIGATDVAGWVELDTRPVSRLRVRAGVRADGLLYRVDDARIGTTRTAQGIQVGPKASVDVALLPKLHALASYGMGFRSPQARSLADGEDAPFTRVHAFEAGLRYRHGTILNASLAAYGSVLSDDLVFNEATSRNEAVPGTLRLGGAASATLTPIDWFVTAFSASYTRATLLESDDRLEEGDLLPYVPQLVVRSDTGVSPVLTRVWSRELKLTAGAGWGFLFNRPQPYGELGSNVFLLDAQVGVRLKEVELNVQAQNLLDADWNDSELTYPSTFGLGPPQAIPRRHVTVGAPQRLLGTVTLYL